VPVGNAAIDNLNIVSGDGVYLYTDTGQKLLDGSAGAAVGNIGWGRTEVAEVARDTLSRLAYTLPLFQTPERSLLVETLAKHWLPFNPRITFCGSGSEANDLAMRVARLYHLSRGGAAKWKIIGRDISYHGTSLSTLAVGGHASRRHGFDSLLLDMPHAPACYCLRCPLGRTASSCGMACARELQTIIDREGADSIAAFIAEPIVGTSGGTLVPPDEYWPEIVKICSTNDILLISDEVLTGFGRTGTAFAQDHWGTNSDIVVLGKGLSGGYSNIAGVATTREIRDSISSADMLPMYNTYAAQPAACATAATVLDILRRESLVERVTSLGPVLRQKMNKLADHPNVAQVRGRGFLYSLEIVRNKETLELYPAECGISMKVMAAAMSRGVLLYPGGTGEIRDIINISPAFIIEEQQMDEIVSVAWDALTEVCRF